MLWFYCSTDEIIRIMFIVTVSVLHCWLCPSTNHNQRVVCHLHICTHCLCQVYTPSHNRSCCLISSRRLAIHCVSVYVCWQLAVKAVRSAPLIRRTTETYRRVLCARAVGSSAVEAVSVSHCSSYIHCVSKSAPTLKRYSSKLIIIIIYFDDIWQKYSKDSRIEHVSVFM